LFEQYDYLLLPSAQVFPFDKTQPWPTAIEGVNMDTYHRWMEVVIPGTLSGCPVANVQAGFNARGLPMGLQIIGRHQADFAVLQLAHAYEQASRWFQRCPSPLLSA
jgi:amidase